MILSEINYFFLLNRVFLLLFSYMFKILLYFIYNFVFPLFPNPRYEFTILYFPWRCKVLVPLDPLFTMNCVLNCSTLLTNLAPILILHVKIGKFPMLNRTIYIFEKNSYFQLIIFYFIQQNIYFISPQHFIQLSRYSKGI